VKPGQLRASGPTAANGKRICFEGDEGKISVKGCMSMAGPFSITGAGTLKIARLAPNQKTVETKHKGKALLFRGTQLTAKCEV